MANIKSAKKRIKVTLRQTMRNKVIKTGTKTAIKKVVTAHSANDKKAAQVALISAIKRIDKATSKGVYHKNTAARKKSTLSRMVNRMS